MTDSRISSAQGQHHDPDSAAPWWWLGAPLALAIALAVLWRIAPDWFGVWVEGELGLVELGQVAVLLVAVLLLARLLALPETRRDRLLTLWLGLALLATVGITGEEASWGQHFFRWATPENWQAVNDQGETNLHNTSSWLDQKPRLLLEIGVIVGGIVVPLWALVRPGLREGRFAIFLPPLLCLPVALVAELPRLYERLVSLFEGGAYIFHRGSEIQELYFYIFIVFYLIALRRRLLAPRS